MGIVIGYTGIRSTGMKNNGFTRIYTHLPSGTPVTKGINYSLEGICRGIFGSRRDYFEVVGKEITDTITAYHIDDIIYVYEKEQRA